MIIMMEMMINTVLLTEPHDYNSDTDDDNDLKDDSYVNIAIYNVAGELVKTLFNGLQNKGKNILIWNAKNNENESVPGGLYIYSVKTENSIYSKKMMLLK